MTGGRVIDVVKFTFVDNNSTLSFIYLHFIVVRPVPYYSPGLVKRFLTYTQYGNIIGVSKDLEPFLIKFGDKIIDEYRKKRRTYNTTLYHSLIDQ